MAIGPRLNSVKIGVRSAQGEKFSVAARFHGAALVQNEDKVGADDRREAVRDDNGHRSCDAAASVAGRRRRARRRRRHGFAVLAAMHGSIFAPFGI
jgi:hypothetical protein